MKRHEAIALQEITNKFPNEIQYWLDGGSLLCRKNNERTWEETNQIYKRDCSDYIFVKNDEFAKYRMAFADGKTIEMKCQDGDFRPQKRPVWFSGLIFRVAPNEWYHNIKKGVLCRCKDFTETETYFDVIEEYDENKGNPFRGKNDIWWDAVPIKEGEFDALAKD